MSFPHSRSAVPQRFARTGGQPVPGGGAPGDLPEDADKTNGATEGRRRALGARLVVVDGNGKISEDWTKWDNFFARPHARVHQSVRPRKNVRVVDDYKEAVFRFSHDGKRNCCKPSAPRINPAPTRHISTAPRFWPGCRTAPCSCPMAITATCVAKFRQERKISVGLGREGRRAGDETRPGYFNVVHGIAADPVTRVTST